MSLKSQIRNATRQAMRAQRTLREKITYTVRGSEETYDANSDTMTFPTDSKENVTAFFSSFEEKDVDGDAIRPMDERCTIELRHIPGVEPKENDFITRTGAKAGVWEIKNVKLPTAVAVAILQVRRP